MIPAMANGEPAQQVVRRAGDSDRDAAIEALSAAAGRGEISLEELGERIEAASRARTLDDLRRLIADITEPAGGALRAPQPQGPRTLRLATSHGHVDRLGGWQVPERLELELSHASSALDFRSSPLPAPGVEIYIRATRSSIRILLPRDMRIDFESLGTHSSKTADRKRGDSHLQPFAQVRVGGDLYQSTFKVLRPKR